MREDSPNHDRKSVNRKEPNFWLAKALARKGRYADASRHLQSALAEGECSEAEALDLQARIYAQQGLHLLAETCWYKAKRLNPANPAYDRALVRLRQARLLPGRLLPVTGSCLALVAFCLLLWQAFFINPQLVHELGEKEISLRAIRREINQAQAAARESNQELATKLGDFRKNLQALDAGFRRGLAALPSKVEMAGNRAELIAHHQQEMGRLQESITGRVRTQGRQQAKDVAGLSQQLVTLADSLKRQVRTLNLRQDDIAAASAGRVTAIEGAITAHHQALDALVEKLARRIQSVQEELVQRVEEIDTNLQGAVKTLPSATEMAALDRRVAGLGRQLEEIAAAVKRIMETWVDFSNPTGSGPSSLPAEPAGGRP